MSFVYRIDGAISIDELNEILVKMVDCGGSDLFVRANDFIRMSIYGSKQIVSNRKIKDGETTLLLSRIHGDNAKSQLGSRSPINTAHEFKVSRVVDGVEQKIRYRFRVNVINFLKDGVSVPVITMRQIPSVPKSARENGVPEEILRRASMATQGLILVVGGTGHGKSTLLSGIVVDQLQDHSKDRNIITIEAPIEVVYDAIDTGNSLVTQLEVGIHCDSFAAGAINTLRMAPNTVIVGESRDYETISAAVEISMTGHVCFSTVHANSVAETFARLINAYPPDLQPQARFSVIQSLTMIVAQVLVKSLDGKRVALREYLALDQSMKDSILSAPNMSVEAARMVDLYGVSMIKDATQKFEDGIISAEILEIVKVNYSMSTQ